MNGFVFGSLELMRWACVPLIGCEYKEGEPEWEMAAANWWCLSAAGCAPSRTPAAAHGHWYSLGAPLVALPVVM